MATINSLPPEILGRIISFSDAENSLDERTREAHCCSMSLVAKSWTWWAQSKLWETVELTSGSKAIALCVSGARGQFVTRRLSLLRRESFSEGAKKQAIEACKGVEALLLWEGSISASILALPTLASLRKLMIGELEITGPFPTSFPFALSSLSIGEDDRTVPLLFDALIKSSHDTLTSLSLGWTNKATESGTVIRHLTSCLEHPKPIAPRLVHLALTCDTLAQIVPITSFLDLSTQLQSLTFILSYHRSWVVIIVILLVLPPSLRTLRLVRFPFDAQTTDVIRYILGTQPQLRHIVLGGCGRGEAEEDYLRAEERLRKDCEERGVELRFESY